MIMPKLKEATRSQHDELEKVVGVMDRLNTPEDYRSLLTRFYRFYSSIEPVIASQDMARFGYNPEARRKVPLLETDLQNLGVFQSVLAVRGTWDRIPVLDTPAKAFGACYVMEGATLGGQVILRELKQQLGLTPENGGAFFNSYGANVGPMWKEFIAVTSAFAETADSDDEIIGAAKETFDSFRNCFLEEPAVA